MQSLTNTNVVPSTLESHLHGQDWGAVAQRLVSHRLAARGTTLEQYAPVFDHAVVLYGKSLIIVMVLPFAALLPLVFRRSRQPFGIHVVFALHVYAFLLLLFCAALAVAAIDVAAGGGGLAAAPIDHALSVVNLAACATYLYVAMGKVYGARGVVRALTACGLAIAAAAILLGYRFVLLLITLLAT
ncbi:MAG TPA: hypothetical protein VGR62_07365 [Candidatus Binatia bacterium]|jgi:hypothetical protein|nr:hypothetical protein [Candidatus Binatia bacterium]